MHLSHNLFPFIVFLTLVIAVVGNNDSSVYFPIDNVHRGISQIYNNGKNSVERIPSYNEVELESLRGTSTYEKYVDHIIAQGITKLTVAINKLLITRSDHQENVLFSPISIAGALALVLLGSNGITFKEITSLWGLQSGIPDIDEKSQIVHEQFARMLFKLNATSGFLVGQEVNFGLAIFVQKGYPIRPIYKSTAQELYASNILNVDFKGNSAQAQASINDWVDKQTNGKIKNILNELPSSYTKVILASALYFKAEWENHFFPNSNTRRRPFFIDGRKSKSNIEVEMMANGGNFPYYKDRELGCEILGLPYKGNKSTMYVVMPFNSSRQELLEFESKITEQDLDRLVGMTKLTGVLISFPKMRLDSTIDLKETLKYLGVRSLFDPTQANLALLSPGTFETRAAAFDAPQLNESINTSKPTNSNIPQQESRLGGVSQTIDNIRQLLNQQSTDNNYQNPGLYAEKVIHKVFMDITEQGTEAAAATSISLTRDGSRVNFRVDVPFCFFIRHDETNTILFWGSVVIPNPNFQTFS